MDSIVLGRTNLSVSVMGIGCGGSSRVGQRTGKTVVESRALIRQALDSGVNFIDTAEIYGTEEIVGDSIKGIDRSSLVLSTKKTMRERITPKEVQTGLDGSLKRLATDYVDIYYLHGVILKDYDYLVSEIVPVFEKMRTQGKVRFIGITEMFDDDRGHVMLQRALQDDIWDVMMVGFNMLNQSARDSVFLEAIKKNIGIVIMYAVRSAFSKQERLNQLIKELIEKKQVNPSDIDENNPLDFLIHEEGAVNLTDAAYRFCRYEPGNCAVLSGTGNSKHLRANIESFSRPPLPREDVIRLRSIFRNVDSVSGN